MGAQLQTEPAVVRNDDAQGADVANYFPRAIQPGHAYVRTRMRVKLDHASTAGLEVVDALMSEPALKTYHLLPSVRGDLLQKLGRLDEARAEFERAAALTQNERERKLLLDRAAACARG